MFNITTKSIQLRKADSDGLRICVMRRIKKNFKFDLWIPELSPPEKLLSEYVLKKKIKWLDFKKKFTKQVIKKQTKLLKLLLILANESPITLLCWEKSSNRCHRKLLLNKLKEMKKAISKLKKQ